MRIERTLHRPRRARRRKLRPPVPLVLGGALVLILLAGNLTGIWREGRPTSSSRSSPQPPASVVPTLSLPEVAGAATVHLPSPPSDLRRRWDEVARLLHGICPECGALHPYPCPAGYERLAREASELVREMGWALRWASAPDVERREELANFGRLRRVFLRVPSRIRVAEEARDRPDAGDLLRLEQGHLIEMWIPVGSDEPPTVLISLANPYLLERLETGRAIAWLDARAALAGLSVRTEVSLEECFTLTEP